MGWRSLAWYAIRCTSELRASKAMLMARQKENLHRITVGEDKAYDTAEHVAALRDME